MTKKRFAKYGYFLKRNLVDTTKLDDYLRLLQSSGMGQNDFQVPGAVAFYKNYLFEELLVGLKPTIQEYTGLKLYETYSYARLYSIGDELPPHTDREACEITVSLCLGIEDQDWPIYLLDRFENELCFHLNPGDALIFRGRELLHWRLKNEFGKTSQVFFHYVDIDGPYKQFRNDNKDAVVEDF